MALSSFGSCLLKPEKTRNGNQWTEARYNSFVKGGLRSASQRWPPKYETLNAACVGQRINPKSGRLAKFYTCNSCKDDFVAKDILPVVLTSGFDSWEGVVARMFCEKEHLEVLCKPCHKLVSAEENKERKNERSKK